MDAADKIRRKELDKQLKVYCDELRPSDETKRNGGLVADKVFKFLQENCKDYTTDRRYVGGSSGKKTAATRTPDLDLIVFVNDVEPIFETTVIPKFIETLRKMPGITIVKKSSCTIQLIYEGFDIDLVPAPNYCKHINPKPSGRILAAWQALGALKKIEADPTNNYFYSSAVAETALAFVRNPNDFMESDQKKGDATGFFHVLVRLAKFWNQHVQIGGKMSGRSTLIELIAIQAGMMEQKRKRGSSLSVSLSLLDAFEDFLKLVQSFDDLGIQFTFDPLTPIRSEVNWKPKNIPNKIKPFVLEPANPYNNMAAINPEAKGLFKTAAKKTLNNLALCDPFKRDSIGSVFSKSQQNQPPQSKILAPQNLPQKPLQQNPPQPKVPPPQNVVQVKPPQQNNPPQKIPVPQNVPQKKPPQQNLPPNNSTQKKPQNTPQQNSAPKNPPPQKKPPQQNPPQQKPAPQKIPTPQEKTQQAKKP